jgi:hypothetical protein
MRIGEFLDALEAVMALLALVFVKWHGLPETLLKTQMKFSSGPQQLETEI